MIRSRKILSLVIGLALGVYSTCSLLKVNALPGQGAKYTDEARHITYDVVYSVGQESNIENKYVVQFDLKDQQGEIALGICPYNVCCIMDNSQVLRLNGTEVSEQLFKLVKFCHSQKNKIFGIIEQQVVQFSENEINWYKNVTKYLKSRGDLNQDTMQKLQTAIAMAESGGRITAQNEYEAMSSLKDFVGYHVPACYLEEELNRLLNRDFQA